ncbi:sugar phosphate isomerase/epimerase family protein [Paenibacillus allorhizosphaerae]|uniref:Inosose dehydratase n=1 Tax=Paenibacillus allorhizosphaerae TaxID=2849866 RepID=A0ABN7TVN3_9BACL|nr:sugar phosphate isomerase/epimerase [Paenibacillus allorhizosphaerae]CAG7657591.1 Inosose dehydratase [Paenibacillus allorhizosphaerae]
MIHKLAVQLYTLREECRNDFPQLLRELKRMGWAGVQMAGYYHYDPAELASVLRETGLQTAGMHVGLKMITDQPEQAIEEARLFGTTDIICPGIPPEQRTETGYREIKQALNEAASVMNKSGLRLSYHNHAFEFDAPVDGVSALEFLLEPLPNNRILAEIDVYWVQKAGLDPASFIRPYAGRMPIIHLKDMTDDEERTYAEIGTGCVDFKPILAWGEASGVEWYVVEQDQCRRNPLDCVQTSISNLTRLISEMK